MKVIVVRVEDTVDTSPLVVHTAVVVSTPQGFTANGEVITVAPLPDPQPLDGTYNLTRVD